MSPTEPLSRIFDAERSLRQAEQELIAAPHPARVGALQAAVAEALALGDREEAVLRLERLADLCAQVPGPEMTDALIDILGDDAPSVRVAAGEALRDVGYERYAEVARGIERALDNGRSGPAMSELPWILAEIGEPSGLPLIRRFLDHPDKDVVASALESLVQLADPEAIPAVERFVDDDREVTIDNFEAETRTTIAQLAREVIETLSE